MRCLALNASFEPLTMVPVRRALRLIGVIAGGQEPSGTDQSDAMERLQSVVMDLPGLSLNGRWREEAWAVRDRSAHSAAVPRRSRIRADPR